MLVTSNQYTQSMEPWEHQPVPGAGLDALDFGLVHAHIAHAQRHTRYQGPCELLAYLKHQQCIISVCGTWHPTRAGLLLFAPDAARWIRASGVDIMQFACETNSVDTMEVLEQVRGTLFQIIDRVTAVILNHIDHGVRVNGAGDGDMHAYPRHLLRELTVNALCHRQWELGTRVCIHLRSQQIVWISPGSLPRGITPENIVASRYVRNPIMNEMLFQGGYTAGSGIGMDTIWTTLNAAGHPTAYMHNTAHLFTIGVPRHVLMQRLIVHGSMDRQAVMLTLIDQRGTMTIKDLETRTGWHRRTLQRDLRALIRRGLIEAIGATNMRHYQRVPASNHGS